MDGARSCSRHSRFEAQCRRKQQKEDEGVRNAVEGRFGVAKRHYSLDRVMARLAESSQTVVEIVFLVMNLERWLSVPFLRFVKWFCSERQLLTEHRFLLSCQATDEYCLAQC